MEKKKLSLESLPEAVSELLDKQERILSMLEASPSNRMENFVNRQEVKKMLNISSDTTVIEMEKRGQLQPYRIGRRVLYKVGDIEGIMKSFKRT